MSLISGIGTASSYLSSHAPQVTALNSVARIQAGEQPFSLDSSPVGAEEQNFVEEYQQRPIYQREVSTDTTGIMLSSETRDFLATLPESQKLPIVSMGSNRLERQETEQQTQISLPSTATQSSSQASILQSQVAGAMTQTTAQTQTQSQRPINQADVDTTYSPQARLVGGGATVEQTLLAGQENVHQKIYENDTDSNDTLADSNLDGSDKQASTRDSEEFKIAGTDTNQEDSADSPETPQEGTSTPENELSSEQQEEVRELKARDSEVRIHEQAHVAAGGGLIRGGVQYDMQTGPDGRSYAVGGSVNIDTSIDDSSPDAMIAKAAKIKAAALAPAEPSSADRAVAATATQMEALGREAKRKESAEDMKQSLESMDEAISSPETSSAELPEVEPIEIESPQRSAPQAQEPTEIGEQTDAQKIQEEAIAQNTASPQINNNVRTTEESRDIVRSTVVATAISTSALNHKNSSDSSQSASNSASATASTSAATLDAPPPKAPLPAERPAPVSKGGSSSLNAPPPKAPLPAEKPAPVSKGGSTRLNSDSEPVAQSSQSISAELQMSPGQERFRSNAINAYQSIRTQAA